MKFNWYIVLFFIGAIIGFLAFLAPGDVYRLDNLAIGLMVAGIALSFAKIIGDTIFISRTSR